MKYHVHVYNTSLMGEANIEANNEEEAKNKIFQMAREGNVMMRFPDHDMLSIAFPMSDNEEFKH